MEDSIEYKDRLTNAYVFINSVIIGGGNGCDFKHVLINIINGSYTIEKAFSEWKRLGYVVLGEVRN